MYPDSKVHGANMGPIWGRKDPGGPHDGPMNFAIWVAICMAGAILIKRVELRSSSYAVTEALDSEIFLSQRLPSWHYWLHQLYSLLTRKTKLKGDIHGYGKITQMEHDVIMNVICLIADHCFSCSVGSSGNSTINCVNFTCHSKCVSFTEKLFTSHGGPL